MATTFFTFFYILRMSPSISKEDNRRVTQKSEVKLASLSITLIIITSEKWNLGDIFSGCYSIDK